MDKPTFTHIVYSGMGGTADYVLNLIKGDTQKTVNHQIIFYGVEAISEALKTFAKEITQNVVHIQKQPGIDKTALKTLKATLTQSQPNLVTLHVNSLIYHLPQLVPNRTKIAFVEHQANHLKSKKEFVWSVLAQFKADFVVSLTTHYQEQLRSKLGLFYRKKKNHLIPTGIDLNDYKKEDENEPLKIGMVARINALKDHETLLKAFTELAPNNAELHLAGNGDLLEKYKSEFKQDAIYFHGFIPQAKIPQFLSQLAIYVQASFGETSSVAVMQARATGLPIIGSNVQGLNNVLNTKDAILVETKNIKAMKAALQLLIENKDKRLELSRASLKFAKENLDHQKMFNSFKALYS